MSGQSQRGAPARLRQVVVTGSTGMVGGLVVAECLRRPDIGSVTTIVRRPTDRARAAGDRLREIVHADFLDLTPILDSLEGLDAAFFCLGVYTGQVPPAEFRRITVDYAVTFAAALRARSPHATFGLLSGQGADPSGKSRLMYARDKGAAENALATMGFERLLVFRPAYIYPVTPRREPNLSYRILRALYPFARRIYPNLGIDTDRLAAAMVRVVMDGDTARGRVVWENRDLRAVR